jgi:acetyl-CoA C-acetyltransferase
MQRFLQVSDYGIEDIAEVAAQSRRKALGNPLAPYGARLAAEDVVGARPVATPVTEAMFPDHADAAVVVVLGDDRAASGCKAPVWLSGYGWGSGSSVLERRDLELSIGTAVAAQRAYREAEVDVPEEEIDAFYISDLYAHRLLMHLEALRLTPDELPFVNPDGGSLGMGDLIETNGGARLFDAVRMLRQEAGAHQYEDVERVLVHGWRGLPTDSCAVVILDAERSAS